MQEKEDIVFFVISGTVFVLLLLFAILFVMLKYQRRRQQHTHEMAEMKSKYDQTLLQSQLEIQEQTLRTISQEIHDNIGQVLTLAKLQINTIQDKYLMADLSETKNLISQSINDLRDLSKSLNPDRIADIGLLESIRHELQLLQKTTLMTTNFEVKGAMQRLGPEREIIVFRIFQELMQNAMKHSEAAILRAFVEYGPEDFQLVLEDNGKGFDADVQKGIGLKSMYNRAAMIQATLSIESALSKGTTAILKVAY